MEPVTACNQSRNCVKCTVFSNVPIVTSVTTHCYSYTLYCATILVHFSRYANNGGLGRLQSVQI